MRIEIQTTVKNPSGVSPFRVSFETEIDHIIRIESDTVALAMDRHYLPGLIEALSKAHNLTAPEEE